MVMARPVTVSAAPSIPQTPAGVISTVGGGLGGPERATNVAIDHPSALALAGGRLYVADDGNNAVRVIDTATDRLSTVTGQGLPGDSGDSGPARDAFLNTPGGLAVDRVGNLLIADTSNNRIRVVAKSAGTFYGQAMTAGDIYAVAGTGVAGFSGDGGPATAANLNGPDALAVDPAGNVVIPDAANNRVRVVAESTGTFYGQAMTPGDIYTVAGMGTAGFSGDGGPADSAEMRGPASVALDSSGNLLLVDLGNRRVRVVAVSKGTFYGQAMIGGDIYTVAGDGNIEFSGEGGPATQAGIQPITAVPDWAGNLVVSDGWNRRLRVVAGRTGRFYGHDMVAEHIYTVAGTGSPVPAPNGTPARSAAMPTPAGVLVDPMGNLVVSLVEPAVDIVQTIAVRDGTFYGLPMRAFRLYTVAGDGTNAFSGDGGPALAAEMHLPEAVTADQSGNVVFTDTANSRIRVIAVSTGKFYGLAMIAGDIYTVAGTGAASFSGDGGPAADAEINQPEGVTFDRERNLIVADTGNGRVRVVPSATGRFYGIQMTAGDIYTVAGNGYPGFSGDGGRATKARMGTIDITVDRGGNLVVSDYHNDRVRVVAVASGLFYGVAMTAGDIYTVAGDGHPAFSGDGGPATGAGMGPVSAVADQVGNLVVADWPNNRIRVVATSAGTFYGQAMTAGDIYTVAGTGVAGFSGDGGPATAAMFRGFGSIRVDPAGDLVIPDFYNDRVRMVAATTATIYGVAMTAGNLYTVAGDGQCCFSGDGGPAIAANLNGPDGVAMDHAGNLIIADTYDNRIRQVSA